MRLEDLEEDMCVRVRVEDFFEDGRPYEGLATVMSVCDIPGEMYPVQLWLDCGEEAWPSLEEILEVLP